MSLKEQEEKLKSIGGSVEREEAILKQCFTGINGEKALKLLRRDFYDKRSYSKGDPHHTAFREGQRSVVGQIIEITKGER